MSHPSDSPELPYCRNCHFTLATPRPIYCGHCGQETDLHPPSVREMFTEYLGHYVAFDGPLWRTLWALVCLPGHLTLAYFHGQRRRYVLPLRVYLSASFLFFVGSHLLGHDALPAADADDESPPAVVAREIKAAEAAKRAPASPVERAASGASAADAETQTVLDQHLDQAIERCALPQAVNCNWFERGFARSVFKANQMSREQWTNRLVALAPYGMLGMQPLYAALLLLMFAGSGRRYAEHFVFSLHIHSLWFLALLFATTTDLAGPVSLAVFGHGLVALQRVYGLGRWGAIWRGLLLTFGYLILLVLGLVLLALFAIVTA
jgi:hypothetical protein